MGHTVFKLTFDIPSLFTNVHHVHAIFGHQQSMMWSRLFSDQDEIYTAFEAEQLT
jgi:hypothetical protein